MATVKKHHWNDSIYIKAHELAMSGIPASQVAKALGIPRVVWDKWMKTKPVLREIFDRTHTITSNTKRSQIVQTTNSGERFIDYIYKRLSPDLRKLWEEIEHLDGGPIGEEDPKKRAPNCEERIHRLFERDGGKRARQSLFVHALVASNFQPVEAMRKVCLSYQQLRRWEKEPGFKELLDEIVQMKADFVRGGIFRQVAAGEPSILKWAGERLCPEFAPPKQTIRHEGEIASLNRNVNLDVDLDKLPLEDRLMVLNKLRQAEQAALPPIDVTPVAESA